MKLHLSLLGAVYLASASASQAQPNAHFDYLLYCGGCHLEDGSGDPPEVPDLRQDLGTFVQMARGRSYMARVPGSADAPISPAQLAGVLNWIVTSYYEDIEFKAFTVDEIEKYKKESPLLDPLTMRTELLKGDSHGNHRTASP